MARRNATNVETATLADVIQLGRAVEAFTADPLDPADYLETGTNPAVQNFRSALAALINTIVHIPRKVGTAKERITRAEAETLRSACELFEIVCEHQWATRLEGVLEVRKAMTVLDAALVRFAVIAS